MSFISYLTKIRFADDILEEALRADVAALRIRRPLIVTDTGVVNAGLLEPLLDALSGRVEPVLFSSTPGNPTEAACRRAAEMFTGHQCDGLIGFGGGSSLDLAKAAGILATHDGPLSSYAAVEGGTTRIRDIIPPIITVPTTAGTGAEIAPGALIVLDDGRKLGLLSLYLMPKVAICDPTLTLTLPPHLTAGTGMDAITHCIETYIATAYNPPADGIALDGLRRAAGNIERAVDKGSDLNARREMMAAAMNGGLALQKGLGGVHAMSHALGGLRGRNLHHGTLNAVLLPPTLEFNAPAVHHRFPALRQALRLDTSDSLPQALHDLSRRLGLPTTLGAMGIDRNAIEHAAPHAEKDHNNGTNPRRATSVDYLRLMAQAL